MQAVVVKEGARLELSDQPDPVPREGELLVQVKAAGVNRADLAQRRGLYPPPAGESEIMGLEIAGVVERAAGGFREGDRVMALLAGGGYATRARVPAAQAMPIPAGMSFEQAAAIPEAFLTAFLNLFVLGALRAGEVVVIHAAGSGVGTAALQLCRGVAGVILATSSPGKQAACRALGATHVLPRDEVPTRLSQAVREAAGRGADLILDLVGGASVEASFAALGLQGRLLCVSTMGGSEVKLDLGRLLHQRLTVMGSTLRSRSASQKARLVRDFAARALPRFERGELTPVLAKTFPLAQAESAHEVIRSAAVVGKVVLVP